MTDKVQKIREEVERLYNQSLVDENRQADRGLECAANVSYGQSKACKQLLSFIDSVQEEPVSDELEDAAFDYAEACKYEGGEKLLCVEHFKAGAKWQMAQMIKDATEVTVHIDAGGYPYIPQMELYDYDKDIPLAKEGDKYKVILIKEN